MGPNSSGEEKEPLVPQENISQRETGGTPIFSVFSVFPIMNYVMNPEQELDKWTEVEGKSDWDGLQTLQYNRGSLLAIDSSWEERGTMGTLCILFRPGSLDVLLLMNYGT